MSGMMERVARGIAERRGDAFPAAGTGPWYDLMFDAKSAIEAMRDLPDEVVEAGLADRPPTYTAEYERWRDNLGRLKAAHRAMIDAALTSTGPAQQALKDPV